MRPLRDLADAGMRPLRELAAALGIVADSVVEAADLLAGIFDSTVRLVRGLMAVLRVLHHGVRRVAVSVVHLMDISGRLRALFAPGSLDRYRQQYRRDDRLVERELTRRARERDVADAEMERAHRRRRDSDGSASASSGGSTGSSGSSGNSSYFSASSYASD